MRVNFYDVLLTEDKTISLVKEKAVNFNIAEIKNPENCFHLACDLLQMDKMAEEYCYMIALNAKAKILGVFLISKGTTTHSTLSPKDIFKRALLSGAEGIILLHNHPSGDPVPSKEDIHITKNIKDAGNLMDVKLLDHIIVGDEQYYSFSAEGGL